MTGVLLQSHNVLNVLIIVNHRDVVSCLKSNRNRKLILITILQQSTVVFFLRLTLVVNATYTLDE